MDAQQYRDGLDACVELYAYDLGFIDLFNILTGYHFEPACPQDSVDREEFNLFVQKYVWIPRVELSRCMEH